MSDKFYVMRSGRIVYRPGHRDIEGARATMQRSLDTSPRRLHEIVRVVEQYEQLRGECAQCHCEIELNKLGNARLYCETCAALRESKRNRAAYKDGLVLKNEMEKARRKNNTTTEGE